MSPPIDGAVSERRASVGEFLAAGAPVATIVKLHPLRLRLAVPERDSTSVRVGQSVVVTVEGVAGEHKGRVARVSPSISEQNRTLLIEAEVPNEGSTLRPGAFAKAEIVLAVVANQEAETVAMALDAARNEIRRMSELIVTALVEPDLPVALHGAQSLEKSFALLALDRQRLGDVVRGERRSARAQRAENFFAARNRIRIFAQGLVDDFFSLAGRCSECASEWIASSWRARPAAMFAGHSNTRHRGHTGLAGRLRGPLEPIAVPISKCLTACAAAI